MRTQRHTRRIQHIEWRFEIKVGHNLLDEKADGPLKARKCNEALWAICILCLVDEEALLKRVDVLPDCDISEITRDELELLS